jgi:hypothetical protein
MTVSSFPASYNFLCVSVTAVIIWALFNLWLGFPVQALPCTEEWTHIWLYTLIASTTLPFIFLIGCYSGTKILLKPSSQVLPAQDIAVQLFFILVYLGLAAYGILEWAVVSESCTSFLEAENWVLLLNFKALTCFMCLGFVTQLCINVFFMITQIKDNARYERIFDQDHQDQTAASGSTSPTVPA